MTTFDNETFWQLGNEIIANNTTTLFPQPFLHRTQDRLSNHQYLTTVTNLFTTSLRNEIKEFIAFIKKIPLL